MGESASSLESIQRCTDPLNGLSSQDIAFAITLAQADKVSLN